MVRGSGGKVLVGPGGLLAASTACCCSNLVSCPCCPHYEDLCVHNCQMDVVITGAIAGGGPMFSIGGDPCHYENGIPLTDDCGTPGMPGTGFAVTVDLGCVNGADCVDITFGAAFPGDCGIEPDTSRGARDNGWYSFTCNPFRLEFHYKTFGAACPCGAGTAITVVVTEHGGCP